MAYTITCTHCQQVFTAAASWLAEIAIDAHTCEKHKPVLTHICPMLEPVSNGQQRDISQITTMEVLDKLRQDAQKGIKVQHVMGLEYVKPEFDDELWQHLEGRLRYMLNAQGLR